jgi:hypothetical protein
VTGARTRLVAAAATVVAVAGLALAGCSNDSGGGADGDTDLSLPSSLSAPTTAPGASTSTTTSTSIASTSTTAKVPPTNPAAPGAPVLSELTAVAGPCTSGNTTAVVTYRVEPEPPVRIVSAFLDGTAAGTSTTAEPITLPPVPCDGAIHQVQVIATGTDGTSSARAAAFNAPRR